MLLYLWTMSWGESAKWFFKHIIMGLAIPVIQVLNEPVYVEEEILSLQYTRDFNSLLLLTNSINPVKHSILEVSLSLNFFKNLSNLVKNDKYWLLDLAMLAKVSILLYRWSSSAWRVFESSSKSGAACKSLKWAHSRCKHTGLQFSGTFCVDFLNASFSLPQPLPSFSHFLCWGTSTNIASLGRELVRWRRRSLGLNGALLGSRLCPRSLRKGVSLADHGEGITRSIWYTAELLAEKAAEKVKATYLLVCVFIYSDKQNFSSTFSSSFDLGTLPWQTPFLSKQFLILKIQT